MSRIDTATLRQATEDVLAFGVVVSEQAADQIERTNDAISRLSLDLARAVEPAGCRRSPRAGSRRRRYGRACEPHWPARHCDPRPLRQHRPPDHLCRATFAAFLVGRWVAGIAAAALSVRGLATALVVLRGALMRTGIGALIVGAGELVYQFTRPLSGAGGFGEAMSLLKDVAVEVWERIKMGAAAGAAATAMFVDLKADAASGMQSAIESVVAFGNTAANTFEGAYEAIKAIWGLLPAAIGDLAFQAASTPAYRGTAYVVFEELALSTYGNRLPQLSFEVFRPLADPDTAEGLTRAVTMIPASGEFTYATQAIRKSAGGATQAENLNALPDATDMVVALDRLQAMAPAVESVSLVVAWFGDDLRAGSCKVRPGVEVSAKSTKPRSWSVNGVSRANAFLVSRDDQDRPVYGGTPSDFAVVQAIQEMKARGLRGTFYPFILMDVPPGNTLPNPYSDNAAETGQPAFPWRGRITCSPAAGFAGTVDKTSIAATQVAALFGAATPASFSVSGQSVSWIGPSGDWGLRRMVLHYAHLCAAAGGVDAFLIGTEMPGLTTIRSGASTYPAVQAYRDLLADVRSILGSGTKIGYAADWSENFGHQPGDGSGDVFFHLDPLWADPEIDFVGIDNYMPLSDWRDGFEPADAAEGWPAIYDRAYLQGNIAGGEGFDWFYASAADRSAQVRTAITDGAAAKPWVFRYKDLRAWWSNPHYNRPGGVESGTPTAWVPQSKPIWVHRARLSRHRPGHQPAQRLLRPEVVGELHAAFLSGLAR